MALGRHGETTALVLSVKEAEVEQIADAVTNCEFDAIVALYSCASTAARKMFELLPSDLEQDVPKFHEVRVQLA